MSGLAAHALLSDLAAAGVRVELGTGGATLELSGKRPTADLLERVRASKPALLEALRSRQGAGQTTSNHFTHEVKTVTPSQEARPRKGVSESHTPRESASAPPVLSSPDEVNAIHPTPLDSAKADAPPRPDWAALGSQPGHCGSCTRWEDAPDWGPLMGECMAGRRAHGWPDGNPSAPVVIHMGHRCAAHDGTAYRSKTGGKRGGPRLPPAGPAAQVAP